MPPSGASLFSCDNDLEDDGLADLCHLLMKNKSIRKVRYENNEVQTGNAYYSFFDQLKGRGAKLDIMYPDKEIYEMHKAKIIDGKSVNYILQCYETISNENENGSDDDDDNSESSDGSDIFVLNSNPNMKVRSDSSAIPLGKTGSDYLQNEWTLVIPPVSLPETTNQMSNIDRTYNIATLIQRVRSV